MPFVRSSMPRFRRYRIFVIFAIVTLLAVYKFKSSGNSWRESGLPVPHGDNAAQEKGNEVAPVPTTTRPQVALETKKFHVEIPAAKTPSALQTPPPIPTITRPVDKAPPPPKTKARPSPKPIGMGGPENDRPVKSQPNLPVFDPHGYGHLTAPAPPPTVSPIHFIKPKEHFPVPSGSTIQLPTGSPKPIPKIQFEFKPESPEAKAKREGRLHLIRNTFNKSWTGYKEHAWMHDELMPQSGQPKDPFGNWGATLVDSLDTLWILGFKEEFEEAVEAVNGIDFTTTPSLDIKLFETTIRYLGGLLAAYDLAGMKHQVLLKKAVELAEVLIAAFDTPNRMPQTYYIWRPPFASQPHRASNTVVLAEIGSLSMEFTRLAQLTGEPKYYDAIARITDELEKFQNHTRLPGMWPTKLDASGCKAIDYSNAYESPDQAPLEYSEAGGADAPKKESEDSQEIGESIPEKKKMVPLDKPEPITFVAGDPPTKGKIQNWDSDTAVDQRLAGKAPTNAKRQLEDGSMAGPEAHPAEDRIISPAEPSPEALLKCLEQGFVSHTAYGSEQYTLGGLSDSTYEYLPKEYLLLGGRVEKYRTMYEKSIEVVKKNLIFRPMLPNEDDILMSGSLNVGAPETPMKQDRTLEGESAHLTCFAGGMFGLGAKIFNRKDDLELAKKLTEGCVWAYNSTATGIMPESFLFIPCEDPQHCKWNETAYWRELDPNANDRMYSYERQMESYHEQMAIANKEYAAALASYSAAVKRFEAPRTLVEVVATPSAHPVDLNKRQLADDPVTLPGSKDEVKIPTYPRVLEDEEDPQVPTRVRDDVEEPEPSPIAPVFPSVYSPAAPLSHEKYVQNRIQEERLPPGCISVRSREYILRPEAIESVWYMYRITGDPHWREVGWTMFLAIDAHTSTVYGNSAIDDVTKRAPELRDSMESFWLAETLKYFYLLFAEESLISLDEWVLNTEAHPFRRPTK